MRISAPLLITELSDNASPLTISAYNTSTNRIKAILCHTQNMQSSVTPPSRSRHYLVSALIVALGSSALYLILQLNSQLQPILPPLAAQRNLQSWLLDNTDELMSQEPLYHLDTVSEIYRRTHYQLLWLDNYQLSSAGEQLLQQLQETSADELREYHYHTTYLRQRLHNLQTHPSEAASIDILLSDAFVSYASDVLNDNLLPDIIEGNPFLRDALLPEDDEPSPPKTADFNPDEGKKHVKFSDIINLVSDNRDPEQLKDILIRLTPAHDEYHQLRQALNHYRDILYSEAWQPLASGPTLKVGRTHPQVAQVRQMLYAYGDLPDASLSHSETFDQELSEALKRFQARNGEKDSGIVDKKTRRLLNIPPSLRIKQIALNMKRWRQLPRDLGERYIWVNLTNYQLQLMNQGQPELEMRVIVGKSYRQTPVLQEFIRTVVLNPTWNVPRRITLYDILPKAKKDPSYLSQRNIEVLKNWNSDTSIPLDEIDWANTGPRNFPYRLRQAAGEDNALGVVKFVIPNDLSIYLHDTNHRDLFEKDMRSLSSGCVRVEKPLELANALLKGKPGWDEDKIQQTLDSQKTTYVRLPENVPTYLMYWTAWVDDKGTVQFRDDIYKHDIAHIRAFDNSADSLIL